MLDKILLTAAAVALVGLACKVLSEVGRFLWKILEWIAAPKDLLGSVNVRGTFRPHLSTILGALLIVITLCGAAFLLFVVSLNGSQWLGMTALGILFVVPITAKKLWNYFRKKEQVAVQRTRDRRALAIRSALIAGRPSPYCLYLRPFESTGRLGLSTLQSTMTVRAPGRKKTWTEHDERTSDLETLLARALESYAPLVGLGAPGEMVGAGRISAPDESWQDEFRQLAKAAKLILLLPSSHKGTAWELARVLSAQTLLAKTIFLFPPGLDPDALRGFAAAARIRLENFVAQNGRGGYARESGVAFRWNRQERAITFAAPLITYVGASPFRFLMDLWLSRETVVISQERLKRDLMSVVEYGPQAALHRAASHLAQSTSRARSTTPRKRQ